MALGTLYLNEVGLGEMRFAASIFNVFGGTALGEMITGGGGEITQSTGALCLPIIRGRGRGLLPLALRAIPEPPEP